MTDQAQRDGKAIRKRYAVHYNALTVIGTLPADKLFEGYVCVILEADVLTALAEAQERVKMWQEQANKDLDLSTQVEKGLRQRAELADRSLTEAQAEGERVKADLERSRDITDSWLKRATDLEGQNRSLQSDLEALRGEVGRYREALRVGAMEADPTAHPLYDQWYKAGQGKPFYQWLAKQLLITPRAQGGEHGSAMD